MLVLGVVTKVSSHPVGSKSFVGPALESNGVLPALSHKLCFVLNIQHPTKYRRVQKTKKQNVTKNIYLMVRLLKPEHYFPR